jgi:hypothetical protein
MFALKLHCAAALVAVTVLSGCAGLTTQAPDPYTKLMAAMAGQWDNRAQFANAPAALKVAPSVAGEWLDLQHASFTRVSAPAIGNNVLYLEWRSGGPQATISRQRIWSFRNDASGMVRMDFFAFVDGKPLAGRAGDDGAFANLKLTDLRGYSEACALRFRVEATTFVGTISATECSIVAASGRRMGIDATVSLAADGTLSYRESGQLDDGRFAFRVPPTQPYLFRRIN